MACAGAPPRRREPRTPRDPDPGAGLARRGAEEVPGGPPGMVNPEDTLQGLSNQGV